VAIILGPWDDQRWAANLHGQSYDDVSFIAGGGGGPVEYQDSATVYVDIQVASADIAEYTEAATVLVDLQTSGTEIAAYSEAATVYIDIQNTGGECYSTSMGDNFGSGEAILEWSGEAVLEWSSESYLEWTAFVSVGDEVTC
jgi:hypothetical protein